ncbi:nuclease-related domain-containing protein [Pseudoneobacillus sp. C159]
MITIMKPRLKSMELMIQESLNCRTILSPQDKGLYLHNKKGFEGELEFDKLLENVNINGILINDLLIKVQGKYSQIDSILITKLAILLSEVKNFEGDYYIENGKWYFSPEDEIDNPVTQLDRCSDLFRRMLNEIGYSYPIEKKLVFVNPNFTLYQAPLNLPIILPTQLNRFVNHLNSMPSQLNETHYFLAKKILDRHIAVNPYSRIPSYTYEELKKGIICSICHSFLSQFNTKKVCCNHCGAEEDVKLAVLRSTKELQMLFPDMPITTNLVYEWCGIVRSKRAIREILHQNFTVIGQTSNTHYE